MVIDFSPFHDMNQILNRIMEESRPSLFYSQRAGGYPPLNISDDDAAIHIRCEVPGLSIEDIEISLIDSSLSIKGERKAVEGKYYRQERPYGPFQRVLSINGPIDKDNVEAKLKDGILEIRLPKGEAFKPRKISIDG